MHLLPQALHQPLVLKKKSSDSITQTLILTLTLSSSRGWDSSIIPDASLGAVAQLGIPLTTCPSPRPPPCSFTSCVPVVSAPQCQCPLCFLRPGVYSLVTPACPLSFAPPPTPVHFLPFLPFLPHPPFLPCGVASHILHSDARISEVLLPKLIPTGQEISATRPLKSPFLMRPRSSTCTVDVACASLHIAPDTPGGVTAVCRLGPCCSFTIPACCTQAAV